MLRIPAEPEPVEIDPARTAVIVVDMQNAFASKGGMLELAGMDITGAEEVVAVHERLLAAARAKGIDVVYLQIGYDADQVDAGGPDSPNPLKELAMCLMRALARPVHGIGKGVDDKPDEHGVAREAREFLQPEAVDALQPVHDAQGSCVLSAARASASTATMNTAMARKSGTRLSKPSALVKVPTLTCWK